MVLFEMYEQNDKVRYYNKTLTREDVPYGEILNVKSYDVDGKIGFTINDKEYISSATLFKSLGSCEYTIRINRDTRPSECKYYNIMVHDINNNILINLVPVRRLGDSICGMFDTINQKFYSSETQYQFIGGDIKMIDKEQTWIMWDGDKHNIEYQKSSTATYYRNPKSFIVNAINKQIVSGSYSKNITETQLAFNNDNVIWYAEPHEPYSDDTPRHFHKSLFNKNTSYKYYIKNVNPNYSVYDSDNTNNEIIYIKNKETFSVYNTGTTTPAENDGFIE